jgi:hypothetical protein
MRFVSGIQQAAVGETIQGLRFNERGPFAFRAGTTASVNRVGSSHHHHGFRLFG